MSDTNLLASEFGVPFAFTVVNAMMLEILTQANALSDRLVTYERIPLTGGSTKYLATLRLAEDFPLDIGTISIFMLDENLTYIKTTVLIRPIKIATDFHQELNLVVALTLKNLMQLQVYTKELLNSPQQKALLELDQDFPRSTDHIPDPPEVERDGWDSVLIYYALHGKTLGVTTDDDIARRVGRSVSTVQNQRSMLGLSRRGKKTGNDREHSGN